eukprot:CFRG0166T1
MRAARILSAIASLPVLSYGVPTENIYENVARDKGGYIGQTLSIPTIFAEKGSIGVYKLRINEQFTGPVTVLASSKNTRIIQLVSQNVHFNLFETTNNTSKTLAGDVEFVAGVPGVTSMTILVTADDANVHEMQEITTKVTIVHSLLLERIVDVLGWACFFLWSASFYPQGLENLKRQSVVGLNLDSIAYNLSGFLSYALFNLGMYFSSTVQREYFTRHPDSVLPVSMSDVAFAVHAVLLTVLVAVQAMHYKKHDQSVTRHAIFVNFSIWASAFIMLFVVWLGNTSILSYLQGFSTTKLVLTVVRYVPQIFFNYSRQSTAGFSVGTQLFDVLGGLASVLQMVLLAVNSNDWSGFIGNPTKIGLALVSIVFDVILIVQHYHYMRRVTNAHGEKCENVAILTANSVYVYGAVNDKDLELSITDAAIAEGVEGLRPLFTKK